MHNDMARLLVLVKVVEESNVKLLNASYLTEM